MGVKIRIDCLSLKKIGPETEEVLINKPAYFIIPGYFNSENIDKAIAIFLRDVLMDGFKRFSDYENVLSTEISIPPETSENTITLNFNIPGEYVKIRIRDIYLFDQELIERFLYLGDRGCIDAVIYEHELFEKIAQLSPEYSEITEEDKNRLLTIASVIIKVIQIKDRRSEYIKVVNTSWRKYNKKMN